ncbi:MAG: tryptophan halogenase family protein [Inhella sp.]
MRSARIQDVLILGGGSAGWLAAALLAAERGQGEDALRITLVESPNTPPIGVGEGTWPTMRDTLRRIGLSERDLLRHADAAFKQGSRFVGWRNGQDVYHHPFSLPQGHGELPLVAAWAAATPRGDFAAAVGPQPAVCLAARAPKQSSTPDYAAVLNYGYHFDAGRFVPLLQRHAVQHLGVQHRVAHVQRVERHADGDIAALHTEAGERLAADLFIDCSGLQARLIGQELGVPWVSQRGVLFNDRALAVQMPHADPQGPLASQTLATAHSQGWIWEIGLPTRRGVGCVFASDFASEAQAHDALQTYLAPQGGGSAEPRLIRFDPGHRARFWERNCLAVGLAGGFIEPLEASALALIELSVQQLCDDFPVERAAMHTVVRRMNDTLDYRWGRLVEFLKLHYVLSERDDSAYWRAHLDPASCPDRLREQLRLWAHRPPSRRDLPMAEELFPSASYQYVLYGMGFASAEMGGPARPDELRAAQALLAEQPARTQRLLAALPDHRRLLQELTQEP